MNCKLATCAFLLLALVCTAQQPAPGELATNSAAPANISAEMNSVLTQLEQAAHTTSLDLAHLRIEKWKGDRAFKQDATSKTESLERNMTAALPGMVANVRAAPGSMAPALKLYRNLNVVYDVLASVAELAGAFGPKDEFRALAADLEAIDTARRSLVDLLERTAAAQDAELVRLRTQSRPAPPSEVKKIVIDDNQPAPKPRKKKPAKPPTAEAKPQ
ncbi:MAG: hypothetical protein L0Z53_27550 [Acidobacteriales bacterium]|nr:hypothetical protein [Terriglobales bacterium]